METRNMTVGELRELLAVPESGTARDQIVYIDVGDLEPDPRNFYSLSDIEGLYTADPRRDANAKRIEEVTEITPEMLSGAGGGGRRPGGRRGLYRRPGRLRSGG